MIITILAHISTPFFQPQMHAQFLILNFVNHFKSPLTFVDGVQNTIIKHNYKHKTQL